MEVLSNFIFYFSSFLIVLSIIVFVHEFGHYYSSNHLSEQYYDGLCDIGAMMYCGFPKAE